MALARVRSMQDHSPADSTRSEIVIGLRLIGSTRVAYRTYLSYICSRVRYGTRMS